MNNLCCKNCDQPINVLYNRKYGGFCLECWNAGVVELIAERDAARAESAALRGRVAELERVAKGLVAILRDEAQRGITETPPSVIDDAITDAYRVLGEKV